MISPETLRRYPLFAGLSNDHLREIAMISEEKHYKAGEWLMQEGEAANELYVVLSGELGIYIDIDAAGERREDMTTVYPGSLTGWAALLTDERSASAEVEKDASVIAIDGVRLKELMEADHTMGFRIMERLAMIIYESLVATNVQLISLT